MEFKKRVLKVKVYGEEIELTYPTVGQFKSFQKKLDGDVTLDDMIDFLEMLGMKKEITESLEPEHLNLIIQELTGSEKK